MSKDDLREKVETEEDFINAKGYKNSLTRFKTYYKSKVPEKQIAYMLASTVEEIEEWIETFVKQRELLKRPMTPIAITCLRNKARRMEAAGVDVAEAFEKAIVSGWLSIYEPQKTTRPLSHTQTKLPDYGNTSNRETAIANITEARSRLRGVQVKGGVA